MFARSSLSLPKAVQRDVVLQRRLASHAAEKDKYKILVVGGGAAGLTVANQLHNRFRAGGQALADGDIAVLDAAEFHNYQPGWTLVGSGLKTKGELRKRLSTLVPSHITHIPENVQSFSQKSSSITTSSGRSISYESLVVATGLKSNWDAISGLSKALADPKSGVSSIYSYDTCDKAWSDIEALQSGRAIFTQPAGVIKCAGAPQKIMWMAWDRFRQTGRGDATSVDFYTGMPTMFSVKKYSEALDKLRVQRGVGGHFQHNLTSIDSGNRKATFRTADGKDVVVDYDLLHVVPSMGPLDVVKNSPLADGVGWVDVNKATLRHNNEEFGNVWALGDCSSLPTSKTAAAITGQAPVLTENLYSVVTTGKVANAAYDGYTSCPLLTGYGELMLAEFKYDLIPKESFSDFVDQAVPQKAFYYLKKDFFPWVYYNAMLQGRWFGPKGPLQPSY